MKLMFKILGAGLLILIIAALAFVFTFDANQYKAEIEQQVTQATGRQLNIQGDISLSVLPLGIELNKVELANASGFEQPVFAHIESLTVVVQLVPLLSKTVQVDALSLNGLWLYLEVDKQGNTNWQDLASAQAQDQAAKPEATNTEVTTGDAVATDKPSPLAALAVNGIDFSNAEIQLENRSTNQLSRVSGLSLRTSKIEFDKPFEISIAGTVAHKQTNSEMAAKLDLRSSMIVAQSLQQFELIDLVLNINAKIPAVQAEPVTLGLRSNANINLAQQQINISDAELDTLNTKLTLAATLENWKHDLVVSGSVASSDINLREIANRFADELPVMRGEQALSHFKLTSDFSLANNTLKLAPLTIEFDKSQLNGEVSVALGNTAVRYQLAMDTLTLDDYLPPTAPTPSPKQQAESNSAAMANSSSSATPENDLPIPFELLQTLDVQGKFTLAKLAAFDFDINALSINNKIQNGVINLSPVSLQVLRGNVLSHTTVDTRKKTLQIKQNLKANQLHVAPIADPIIAAMVPEQKVSITGAGDVYADVTTHGLRVSSLKQNLNGKAGILFKNIKANGLDIEYLARVVVTDYLVSKKLPTKPEWRGSYQPKNQTAFDVIKSDFNIKQGVAHTNNLTMDSKRIDVSGNGHINIPAQTLDMKTITDLTPRKLKTTAEKVLDEPIPVHVHGNWTALKYDVDSKPMQRVVKKLAKDKAKKKIEKKLDKKKQELKDKAEDKIKEKLKNLFR